MTEHKTAHKTPQQDKPKISALSEAINVAQRTDNGASFIRAATEIKSLAGNTARAIKST